MERPISLAEPMSPADSIGACGGNEAQAQGEAGATVHDTLARGRVLFMGVELEASPGALVAREETQVLGHAAERALVARTGPQLVIDMCCGSGNLGCALARRVPNTRVYACDLTDGCVSLARRNAELLGISDRVTVHQGDLFEPLRQYPELAFAVDVIVCNPPYISTGKLEKERSELLLLEPREAFDGGPYGIAIHQRVVRDALAFLKPGGVLLFEIGVGQVKQVSALFGRTRSYNNVQFITDTAGEVRVVHGTRVG